MVISRQEYFKKYRKEHRLHIKDKNKKYYIENREKNKISDAKYYKDNRDKILRKHKEYKFKNRDIILEKRKKYYAEHKDDREKFYRDHKNQILEKGRNTYLKLKMRSYTILGGFKCNNKNCIHPTGDIQPDLFEIDHIHDDGNKNRKSTSSTYREIINNPEQAKLKYQILCVACNRIKREENNKHNTSPFKLTQKKLLHLRVVLALGGKCSDPNCVFEGGCSDGSILEVHHIYYGGKKEYLEKYTTGVYRKILRDVVSAKLEYSILCVYCHTLFHKNKNILKSILIS